MGKEEKDLLKKIYDLSMEFMENIGNEEDYTDEENEIIEEIANVINIIDENGGIE